MSNAQKRFAVALSEAQTGVTPHDKMPYLCVIGTHDFDELSEELVRMDVFREYKERVNRRVADEWNPFDEPSSPDNHFETFRERIEQEEFDNIQVGSTPSASPVIAEAEAALDPRQRASMTECLEFCGCKCFRSLNEQRGFWFA